MKIVEFLELDLLSLPGVEKRASNLGPYECFTYKKDEIAFLSEHGLHIRLGSQKIYEKRAELAQDSRVIIDNPIPGWVCVKIEKRRDAEDAMKLFLVAREIPPEEFLPPPASGSRQN